MKEIVRECIELREYIDLKGSLRELACATQRDLLRYDNKYPVHRIHLEVVLKEVHDLDYDAWISGVESAIHTHNDYHGTGIKVPYERGETEDVTPKNPLLKGVAAAPEYPLEYGACSALAYTEEPAEGQTPEPAEGQTPEPAQGHLPGPAEDTSRETT